MCRVYGRIPGPGRSIYDLLLVERLALAQLNHSNIVQLYDVGEYQGGPFNVMELITGEDIATYATQQRLTLPQRLQLFLVLCHAVRFMHCQGVIHGAIAPSKVRVQLGESESGVKLLGFRQAWSQIIQRTLPTIIGKYGVDLKYASPESVALPRVVDTRTDIYSLGCVLYHLLTGVPPLDPTAALGITSANADAEYIRATKVASLADCISESPQRLMSVATNMRMDRDSLLAVYCGGLNDTVAKAIDKKPDNRYNTADQFALEIDRLLAFFPVATPSTRSTAKSVAFDEQKCNIDLMTEENKYPSDDKYQHRLTLVQTLDERFSRPLTEEFYRYIPPEDRPALQPRRSDSTLRHSLDMFLAEFVTTSDALALGDLSIRIARSALASRDRQRESSSQQEADAIEDLITDLKLAEGVIDVYLTDCRESDTSSPDRTSPKTQGWSSSIRPDSDNTDRGTSATR